MLLAAIGLGNLTLYFKLDAFQHASISLVQSLDEARVRQNAIAAQTERLALAEILGQVKQNEMRTNGVADQILEISKQTSLVSHQNADMLWQLKVITSEHTRDIKAAKAAAQRAQVQSKATQKEIGQPWYKKVFK